MRDDGESPRDDLATPQKSVAERLEAIRNKPVRRWVSLGDPGIAEMYLESLAECGNLAGAARAVGCSREGALQFRKKHPEFDQLCQEAMASYTASVHREIRRRAIEGVEQPVYQGGQLVGHITKFSDPLLIMEAKRVMPEYREASPGGSKTTINVNATANAAAAPAITLQGVDPAKLNREQREAFRAFMATMEREPQPMLDVSSEPASEPLDAPGELEESRGEFSGNSEGNS